MIDRREMDRYDAWPAQTMQWYAQQEGTLTDVSELLEAIPLWSPSQMVIHHPCMERRHKTSHFTQHVLKELRLPTKTEDGCTDYGYLFTSPGGNRPTNTESGLEILARNALLAKRRFQISHAFFYIHDGCAAEKVGMAMPPEEGALHFAALYHMFQQRYPNLFFGLPLLYEVHIETATSSVMYLHSMLDQSKFWDAAEKRAMFIS